MRMNKKMTVEEKNKVLTLTREGKSIREIAELMNFPKSTVALIAEQKDRVKEFIECPGCGKTIIHPLPHTGRWQKYCNSECKNKFYRESKYKKHVRSICQCCGKEFFQYTNTDWKYCSRECYINARYYKGKKKD